MLTPLLRPELLDLIAGNWTDPLNGQNTAERARQIAEAIVISCANLLEDGAGGSGNPDLTALLAKINSKQDKAAPVAQDAYGPGRPAQPLATVLEQLDYLFQNSTAASLTYSIADAIAGRDNNDLPLGRPTVAIPDVWNGVGDSVVYLQVEETGRWARYGQLLDAQGNWSFVVVDLDQATAVLDKVDAYTKATIDAMLAGLRDAFQDVPVITRDQAIAMIAPASGLLSPRYIVLGKWNGNDGGVALLAGTKGRFNPWGFISNGNDVTPVLADVRAGTYKTLTELLAGAAAEALHFIYTVQAADVTSPPSPLTISVPGASSFGVVGVEKAGTQGIDPLTPGTMYATGTAQVVVSDTLNPPLAAGDRVIIYYVTGAVAASYSDAQARAAQLNRVAQSGTTTVTLTAESATHYGRLSSGTFTVDPTDCQVGKEAFFTLAPGATAPGFQADPGGRAYAFEGVPFAPNQTLGYTLHVDVDTIIVVIVPAQ